MAEPRFVAVDAAATTDPAAELAASLLAPDAAIAPKYFYDELGSLVFAAITALPEYYPTRTEAAVFERHAGAIADAVHGVLAPRFALVDLGAGDGAKAARLFPALRPGHYVAVDISQAYLRTSLQALQQRFPTLMMTGVGMDFSQRLALPDGLLEAPALVFYPGSSIGNFGPDDALRLLEQARGVARGGALLIGADLVKPPAVLEAAYDDALGLTAAFNLNALRHVNARLGSDFDVADWRHVAHFDVAASRVQMHLEARRDVVVRWPGAERRFAAGARIHTENAYKWTPSSFEALLRDAGWQPQARWADEREWFGVFLARG